MFFTILNSLFCDLSNCYFFILTQKNVCKQDWGRKIKDIFKILVEKLFILDLAEIYNKSNRNFVSDLNFFFERITNSRDVDFPLKYILIKNLENISLEKQLFLKYFMESKGNDIRLVFLGRKIEKINQLLISRGLLINLNKKSSKKSLEIKKKNKKFLLNRRIVFLNFFKKKENLKNFENLLFFLSTFFSKIKKKLRPKFFFPNELFYFFFEVLESTNFERKLKHIINSFFTISSKSFFFECLELFFLEKKNFNFLFFLEN